jgi:nicotinate-nucleotide--dimethylbenzimidazole phosphoribosyltransferase
MGIGNTTAAAALGCALLDLDAQSLTGPGTGLDAAGVARKAGVVGRALARHREGQPSGALDDPFAVLADLGGFEIAAIAGCAIAAAQLGVPLLVDGFIATAAVLAACCANPGVRDWLIFAHRSAEPGHDRLLAALGADPLLDLGLHLGEGSGAALAVPLLRLACALHAEMATFEQAGVSGATG